MMSNNPTTNLRQQRLHRRQQSTPTAYDATRVPAIPDLQRQSMHRRGMSMDGRRNSIQEEQLRVSTTNQGYTESQQHIIREAQQQRLACQAQQPSPYYFNPTNDENYLISPSATPHRSSVDGADLDMYGSSLNSQTQNSYMPFAGNFNPSLRVDTSQVFVDNSTFNPSNEPFTPSAFIDFSQSLENSQQDDMYATIKASRPSSRPVSRPLSRNMADGLAQFDRNIAGQSMSRHLTPPNPNSNSYFPTPEQTPFQRPTRIDMPVPHRFDEDYDESMEATIKPSRKSSPVKSSFQQMREQAEMSEPAKDESRAKMPPSSFFVHPSSRPSSQASVRSFDSPYHSQNSSPELSFKQLHSDPFHDSSFKSSYPDLSGSETRESSPAYSSHCRSRSRSTASHASINSEEQINETGISMDDICQYIRGPDPSDQKYNCLFPDCNKRFGRKENIKSHVQTHLGDRQFQCPHCSKCFVRQHDLKRHAKIHSGVKPYPCKCGNSFARHDALTRHRQRGMCVGAFEGVVKKVVKRGRPRKQRPDDEERREKSVATQQRTSIKKERSNTMSSEGSYSIASEYYSESDTSHRGRSVVPDYGILDSAPFADFIVPNPYQGQQSNAFNTTGPVVFKYDSLVIPPVTTGSSACVSPQLMMNVPTPDFTTGSSNRSVASSRPSRPGTSESYHSSVSPSVGMGYYDGASQNDALDGSASLAPDPDAMFLELGEFGDDAILSQEADLLSLGADAKGFGDGFTADVGDLSLFVNEEGNNWTL